MKINFFLSLSTSSSLLLSLSPVVYHFSSTDPLSLNSVTIFFSSLISKLFSDLICPSKIISVLNSQLSLLFLGQKKHGFASVF